MLAKHTSGDDPLDSDHVDTGVSVALSDEQPNAFSTQDPSVCRPLPDTTASASAAAFATSTTTSPRLQQSPPPAAASARLPRTSSLLPLPRTGAAAGAAAAATTTATLTPAYSPGEAPSFNTDLLLRSENLPVTPPNEPDYETDRAPTASSPKIEPLLPSLPPIARLGSLSDSIGLHRPSSLEVLPGGEASDSAIFSTTSHIHNPSTSSSGGESLSKMSYEEAKDPYAPLHGHSRRRSARGSVDLANKSRGAKPPSQKVMLSRALQMANTAVQLDNAQNFEGARRSYVEACDLLKQVLLKTTADDDRKKLDAIVSACGASRNTGHKISSLTHKSRLCHPEADIRRANRGAGPDFARPSNGQ